jgi:hypothetical protein
VVRADLARLPARNRIVAELAAADLKLREDFLDVLLGVPFLLLVDIEGVHSWSSGSMIAGVIMP